MITLPKTSQLLPLQVPQTAWARPSTVHVSLMSLHWPFQRQLQGWKDTPEPQISGSHLPIPARHTLPSFHDINGKRQIISRFDFQHPTNQLLNILLQFNLGPQVSFLFIAVTKTQTFIFCFLKHSLSSAVILLIIIFIATKTFYQVDIRLFNQTSSQLLMRLDTFAIKTMLCEYLRCFTTSLRYIPRNLSQSVKKIK